MCTTESISSSDKANSLHLLQRYFYDQSSKQKRKENDLEDSKNTLSCGEPTRDYKRQKNEYMRNNMRNRRLVQKEKSMTLKSMRKARVNVKRSDAEI